tara:strand:+ start:1902 stop:2945 length:1044 start_codon:yes stop_codon:yes gene_type:complete
MGKGGGGGSTQAFQSNMPPWARDAHERLIHEAQDFAYGREYPTYGEERIAGFTPSEEAGFSARQEMFERGDPYGDWAATQLEAAGGLPGQLSDIESTYGAQDFDFGRFVDPGVGGGPSIAQQYMSPYQQAVTDAELRSAREEYERQMNRTAAERVSSGAMGGYREAIDQAFGRGEQARTLADIQARGSQKAFENAQEQFQRDRNAAIEAAKMGDSSAFRAAQMGMDVAKANQKRLFDEMEARSRLAGQASDLGVAGQTRGLERIRELERAGVTQREMDQSRMDLAYEDFLRQERWPQSQMNWLQGILAGVPGNMEQYSKSPGPNTIAQLMGLGVGAAGLHNLLKGET